MGLFGKKWDLVGSSDDKEPLKKTGFLRIVEMMDRDGTKFLKSGLLSFVTLLPFIAGVLTAIVSRSTLPLILGGTLGGVIAAPQICGVADTILRSLRDHVGWWWWESYRKAWKQNVRASLLPGAVFGLIYGCIFFVLYYIAGQEQPLGDFLLLLLVTLILLGVSAWYLAMLVTIELPMWSLLRNSLVLFLSHPLKSLGAAFLQLLYMGLILIWFPYTLIILLLGSVWMPLLGAFAVLYPALDKHFGLEAVYAQRQTEQWGGEMDK